MRCVLVSLPNYERIRKLSKNLNSKHDKFSTFKILLMIKGVVLVYSIENL